MQARTKNRKASALIKKLSIKNEELIDEIFPDKDIVVVEPPSNLPYKPNMIVWRNILLYGQQGCLLPKTLISTPKGEKILSELKEGDLVNSWNLEKDRPEYSYITKLHKFSTKELYHIRINNKEIICSDKHRFLTRKGWRRAKDLNIGQSLVSMEIHERGKGIKSEFGRNSIYSRNSRWRRSSLFKYGQDKDCKEGMDSNSYFNSSYLFKRINNLDGRKITKKKIKKRINYRTKTLSKNIFSDSFQAENKIRNRHNRICIKRFIKENHPFSKSKEESSRTTFRVLRKKKVGTEKSTERIFHKRIRYFLEDKEVEFKPSPIRDIFRENKKETTLFDLTTTLGNYFAEGILVHNSGKSELVRKLGEIAIEKYGEENVNLLEGQAGNIEGAFKYLDDKPIQILFIDDLTLVPQAKENLHTFFRIRHHYKEMGKRSSGYILTIMGLHRYHGIPKELRTNFDFLMAKSSPQDKFDRDFLKNYFNPQTLKDLALIDMNKLKQRELFPYSLAVDRAGREGWLNLGMSKKNYFNTVLEDGTLRPYKETRLRAPKRTYRYVIIHRKPIDRIVKDSTKGILSSLGLAIPITGLLVLLPAFIIGIPLSVHFLIPYSLLTFSSAVVIDEEKGYFKVLSKEERIEELSKEEVDSLIERGIEVEEVIKDKDTEARHITKEEVIEEEEETEMLYPFRY